MKRLAVFPVFVLLGACVTSSAHMLSDEVKTYEVDGCRIEVFASQATAEAAGIAEEICRVESSSMFSLDHSIETSVRRGAQKVCGCGASKAYIITAYRHDGASKATMVGFR